MLVTWLPNFTLVMAGLLNDGVMLSLYTECAKRQLLALKITEVRFLQFKNAPPPIFVTVSGIVTVVKLLQPKNA